MSPTGDLLVTFIFLWGRCPLELAQRPSCVALVLHIARRSTPFWVTIRWHMYCYGCRAISLTLQYRTTPYIAKCYPAIRLSTGPATSAHLREGAFKHWGGCIKPRTKSGIVKRPQCFKGGGIYTYVYAPMRAHLCTYMCAYVRAYMACMHACVRACMRARAHARMHACMHARMHACMHACIHLKHWGRTLIPDFVVSLRYLPQPWTAIGVFDWRLGWLACWLAGWPAGLRMLVGDHKPPQKFSKSH